MAEKGKIRRWTRLLVPGLMFQSLLVGGGYGTGAEIARYFGRYGLWGGLLGMGAAAALWSLVCAVTFEFARVFRTWDYGSLMRALLGRWGVWYDLCCFAMTLLVLGVADATAGTMAALAGLPLWTGGVLVSGCAVWCSGARRRWNGRCRCGPMCSTPYTCCFCWRCSGASAARFAES